MLTVSGRTWVGSLSQEKLTSVIELEKLALVKYIEILILQLNRKQGLEL